METLSFSADTLRAYLLWWSVRRYRRKPRMLRPLRIRISAKGAFFSFSSVTGKRRKHCPILSAKTFELARNPADRGRTPPLTEYCCLHYPSQSVNASHSVRVVNRQLSVVSLDDKMQQLSAMSASSNQTSFICAFAGRESSTT